MTRPLRPRYWLAPTQTHLEPAMPTQGKPTVFVRAVSEGETSELFIQGERIAVAGPMSAEEVAAWFNERYGWAAEFIAHKQRTRSEQLATEDHQRRRSVRAEETEK